MKKLDWDKLPEKVKEYLKKDGILSCKDINKFLWKRFDEADWKARLQQVNVEGLERIHIITSWLENLGIKEPKDLENSNDESILRIKQRTPKTFEALKGYLEGKGIIIIRDESWKSLYHNSFLRGNKIWEDWRKGFLKRRPECQHNGENCTKKSTTSHHHPPAHEIAISEGFTKPLKNDNNFMAVCGNCHCEIEGIPIKDS